MKTQLTAFKEGSRKANIPTGRAAIMSAIAAQLSADDIANVAAYFAAQGPEAARSALLPNVVNSRVVFPENKESLVKYLAVSLPGVMARDSGWATGSRKCFATRTGIRTSKETTSALRCAPERRSRST